MLGKKDGKGGGDATRKEGTAERVGQRTAVRITTVECNFRKRDFRRWRGKVVKEKENIVVEPSTSMFVCWQDGYENEQ